MANVEGLTSTRRCLLRNATQFFLLYGAEVWAYVLGKEVYRKRIAQVTETECAVIAVAGLIPVALLTK